MESDGSSQPDKKPVANKNLEACGLVFLVFFSAWKIIGLELDFLGLFFLNFWLVFAKQKIFDVFRYFPYMPSIILYEWQFFVRFSE